MAPRQHALTARSVRSRGSVAICGLLDRNTLRSSASRWMAYGRVPRRGGSGRPWGDRRRAGARGRDYLYMVRGWRPWTANAKAHAEIRRLADPLSPAQINRPNGCIQRPLTPNAGLKPRRARYMVLRLTAVASGLFTRTGRTGGRSDVRGSRFADLCVSNHPDERCRGNADRRCIRAAQKI